jgi:hypothetical protein
MQEHARNGLGSIPGLPETALPQRSRDSDEPRAQLEAAVTAKPTSPIGRAAQRAPSGGASSDPITKLRELLEAAQTAGTPTPGVRSQRQRQSERSREDLSLDGIRERFRRSSR